jgi:hypothetical protein
MLTYTYAIVFPHKDRTSKMKRGFFTFTAAIIVAIVWTIPFDKGVAVSEGA